jgi:diadenosine tetraphosphate (Ap4A) HIT family hydrolase
LVENIDLINNHVIIIIMKKKDCVFCNKIEPEKVLLENKYAFVIKNTTQDKLGRCLIIPKCHVSDFSELKDKDFLAIIKLFSDTRRILKEGYPDIKKVSIHVNFGAAAGQTLPHVHFHVIPYRRGESCPYIDDIPRNMVLEDNNAYCGVDVLPSAFRHLLIVASAENSILNMKEKNLKSIFSLAKRAKNKYFKDYPEISGCRLYSSESGIFHLLFYRDGDDCKY